MKIAKEAILGSAHLQSLFLECQNETLMSTKKKKWVYWQLVVHQKEEMGLLAAR
jgi:hypothetical protein